MNRPKLEDYEIKANLDGEPIDVKIDLSKFGYLLDLEKYCDYLERRNKTLNGSNNFLRDITYEQEKDIDGLTNEISKRANTENTLIETTTKLEKALNKACEHLNELECVIIGSKEHTWGKDQWKEWAMADESIT